MLTDLIITAKEVLSQDHPSDQDLLEVENALSAYLEALATERISTPVDYSELEHANRLLREVRRERSRRMADAQNQPVSDVSEQKPQDSFPLAGDTLSIFPQMCEDDVYQPLRTQLTLKQL